MTEFTELLLLAIVLLVSGVIVAVIGVKQRNDTLKRNWFAGLRTTQTMASDDAWRIAHRATAGTIIAAGAVTTVSGLAVLLIRPSSDGGLAAIVLSGAAITLILVVSAGVRGHRLAQQQNRDNGGYGNSTRPG